MRYENYDRLSKITQKLLRLNDEDLCSFVCAVDLCKEPFPLELLEDMCSHILALLRNQFVRTTIVGENISVRVINHKLKKLLERMQ